jgi:ribosomal protein S18 acetylase RimI-like enzyme
MKHELSDQLRLRHVEPSDHERIVAVIDRWWGGRPMSCRLSHVFFVHFQPTSFIIECDGELFGFLLGFVSQTTPGEAYVHFVGVHPDYRHLGLGRRLYGRFCTVVGLLGCQTVRCHTAPQNGLSIAFHSALGFDVDPGDDVIDGVSVWRDYAGAGEHRVRFVKRLSFAMPQERHSAWEVFNACLAETRAADERPAAATHACAVVAPQSPPTASGW